MAPKLPPVAVNPAWKGLNCTVCGREHPRDWPDFVCADCGADGILDAVYDYEKVAAGLKRGDPFPIDGVYAPPAGRPDLWRFAPLMPMAPEAPHPCWSLGGTPLLAAGRLARHLGLHRLLLKDDTGLPSASLKDRATAVALADAARRGVGHIACASTGNAAASLAVLAARAGVTTTIFVPASAPPAKLAQLELHGATVNKVDGSYDEAFDLSVREQVANGWYSRNCAYNPLLVEGKKTAALELFLELGGHAPDVVFVPTGDGCIVSSTAKAFLELRALGLTDRVPRVYGVQAEGAAPLARAWALMAAEGRDPVTMPGKAVLAAVEPMRAQTYADSICVGVPRNRVKAWLKVARTGGGFFSVSDDQIREAARLMARMAGLWAEPSGAAGFAGMVAAVEAGLVEKDEMVAVLVTGSGLKVGVV